MSRLLRAIVLDFDGVLVESEGLKTEIFRRLFARYPEYYEAMMVYHQQSIAASRFVKFAYLAKLLGRANDQAFLNSLATEFSSLAITQTAACPEVNAHLILQNSHGDSLYLASDARIRFDRNSPTPRLAQLFYESVWLSATFQNRSVRCATDLSMIDLPCPHR